MVSCWLSWDDVDLTSGVLAIRRSLISHYGKTIVKDTKTHQMRRISLDEATVEILDADKKRYAVVIRASTPRWEMTPLASLTHRTIGTRAARAPSRIATPK